MTDHRVSFSIAGVERVLSADSLTPIIEVLTIADERERLEFFLESLERKRVDALKIMKK